MRLLVTGGCGFIGANFVRDQLARHPDRSIVNLDLLTYAGNPANLAEVAGDPRYRFVQGDIRDADLVGRLVGEVDAVIHFAAESHVDRSIADPGAFVSTNIQGTFTLLEAARQAGVDRFVHVSTDEVYGSIAEGAFTEDDPLRPSSPYSASKAGSDLLALAYHTTHDLPVIVTRCSNNYGPFQYPEKLIPLFITNLLSGRKVPVYGSGRNVREWIYVLDHCRALDFVLGQGRPGEVYNIGSGVEKTNLEITAALLALLEKDDSWVEHVTDRKGHDFRYAIDCRKLRGLGWAPEFTFERALAETVEWYRAHEAWWRPLKGRS
ncbi:MAG TPA: dTDP-glucose 4,6-dehydratase [Methanoregulaceae archaeon]|nr:dTDP-glucose 4,6-dehydratase [Methanoregulaceae archaeon]HQJ87186.1 dTDP-glucose 4,6-dehydratase [Methanoregulaceae archaeon]